MHTKDFLAAELRKAGLHEMAAKAATGWYHDFLSPLDFPEMQLEKDLRGIGTPAAEALRQRHLNGEFDANQEESEEWGKSPEGQDAMRRLAASARDDHQPIEPGYRKKMQALARELDQRFNGNVKGKDRNTGFVLLVFPFGDAGRVNYISNGADRSDMAKVMRMMAARFEGDE